MYLPAVYCKYFYKLWNKHLWGEVLSINKTSLLLPIFLPVAGSQCSVSLYQNLISSSSWTSSFVFKNLYFPNMQEFMIAYNFKSFIQRTD